MVCLTVFTFPALACLSTDLAVGFVSHRRVSLAEGSVSTNCVITKYMVHGKSPVPHCLYDEQELLQHVEHIQ